MGSIYPEVLPGYYTTGMYLKMIHFVGAFFDKSLTVRDRCHRIWYVKKFFIGYKLYVSPITNEYTESGFN